MGGKNPNQNNLQQEELEQAVPPPSRAGFRGFLNVEVQRCIALEADQDADGDQFLEFQAE